jgi:hypothetical protein
MNDLECCLEKSKLTTRKRPFNFLGKRGEEYNIFSFCLFEEKKYKKCMSPNAIEKKIS